MLAEFIVGTVMVVTAIGSLASGSNNSNSRRRRRNNSRNRGDVERETEQINQLNRQINDIARDNQRMRELINKKETTEKRFRDEMKRRERERKKEMEKVAQREEKIAEELARVKNQMKKTRQKKKKRDKRKERELKRRKKKLTEEKKEQKKIKQKQKEINELDQNKKKEIKKRLADYETVFKDLIKENNLAAIEDELDKMERDVIILKEVLANGNISNNIFYTYVGIISGIYEALGDMFYQQGVYDRSVNMYENILDLNNSYGDVHKFKFKYGRSLYYVGRYSDAIRNFNEFDLEQIKSKREKKSIEYDLDELSFNAYLALEDVVKIEEQAKVMSDKYAEDKMRLKQLLDILYQYLEYSKDKEQLVTYLSLVAKYKKHRDLEQVINDSVFAGFEFKDFYRGLQFYRDNKLSEAIAEFSKYPDNNFAQIYLLDARRLKEEFNSEDEKVINQLLDSLEKMLIGKKIKLRQSFYQDNNRLIYLDVSNRDHYFRLYSKVVVIKLKHLLLESDYQDLFDLIKKVNTSSKDYSFNKALKRQLAYYYKFFKEKNSKEKSDYIYDVLEEYSTELELKSYLKKEHKFDKEIKDLYQITEERIDYIESPFYFAVKARAKLNQKEYIMLETYKENLNAEKRERKEVALIKEKELGKEFSNFTDIYEFEIDDGVTRIIYPIFKDNFKNRIKAGFTDIKERKDYALMLIEIFENLEKKEIVLSSLNPERIMVDSDDNLLLRDTFFAESFKSESTTSAGSIRNFKRNLYQTVDERRNRDYKSNYYLLGLLLYEIFYGEYIFSGVDDYNTISFLHNERLVDKNKTFLLRDRWIEFDDDINVKVDKVKFNSENKAVPLEIQKTLKSLLVVDQRKRSDSLKKVKECLEQVKVEAKRVSFSKPISRDELIGFINRQEEVKVSGLAENHFTQQLMPDLEQIDQFQVANISEYLFVIDTRQGSFGVEKILSRYKIVEVDRASIKQAEPEADLSDGGQEYQISDLISKTNSLLEEESQFSTYLYQSRQVLYDLEDSKKLFDSFDEYFFEQLKEVVESIETGASIKQLLAKVETEKISKEEFLQLSAEILTGLNNYNN